MHFLHLNSAFVQFFLKASIANDQLQNILEINTTHVKMHRFQVCKEKEKELFLKAERGKIMHYIHIIHELLGLPFIYATILSSNQVITQAQNTF